MTNTLLITFIISLITIVVANRLYTYIVILSFQGFVLFWVSFTELTGNKFDQFDFILLKRFIQSHCYPCLSELRSRRIT
jgi:hypothetical protein